ncbi:MAG: aminotransferase class III-fold pyridoxal phosphate-dependent enzyme [Chloroflexi bacterium]|nr:aminotransferase class III-fold pyridoxal phosphate-dependent enzyme [Chloroflexota bacterium]
MKPRDHTKLLGELAEAYTQHSPRSASLNETAMQTMVDGGSHSLRLIKPFPPRIVSAKGAWLKDEDGHDLLDFWQGHHANILGHNPEVVTAVLAQAFQSGYGLLTGFTESVQIETAEILCRQTGAERVRFTISGAMATMYAILLARAFTQRELVMKVGGGWHGAQPWGVIGVHFYASGGEPWQVESQGLPPGLSQQVINTRFNDPDALHDHFRQYGDRLACFIVEPFVGAGGFIFATPEYLRAARQLTDQYGVVLIFDEVVSGFRFRAGDLGALYGVKPDLAAFAKGMGGGMPVAAVAGRADIMKLCGREGGNKVMFVGGTYSCHPASMLAARAQLTYLVAHEEQIYPHIACLGEKARRVMEETFAQEGIYVRCTGYGNEVVPGSSVVIPNFPYEEGRELATPEDVNDPAVCDTTLRDKVCQLALLLEDVHVVHGGGSLTAAHTEADIAFFSEACHRAARRIKAGLGGRTATWT